MAAIPGHDGAAVAVPRTPPPEAPSVFAEEEYAENTVYVPPPEDQMDAGTAAAAVRPAAAGAVRP